MCVTGLKTEKWFEERKNMLDDIYRRYNDITIWLTNDGNNRFAVKVSITRIMILMKETTIGKTNGLITGTMLCSKRTMTNFRINIFDEIKQVRTVRWKSHEDRNKGLIESIDLSFIINIS